MALCNKSFAFFKDYLSCSMQLREFIRFSVDVVKGDTFLVAVTKNDKF